MKKIICIISALALLLSLAACSASKSSEETSTESVSEAVETTENAAENAEESTEAEEDSRFPYTFDEQIECLNSFWETWMVDGGEYELYNYVVADLNNDGRLELISTTIQGTGLFTYSLYWTVNDTCDGVVQLQTTLEETDSEPDIGSSYCVGYYNSDTDVFTYIFDDDIRNGYAESYDVKDALHIEDDVVVIDALGSTSAIADEDLENYTYSYYDSEGSEISEDDFNALEENCFSGCVKFLMHFGWTQITYGECTTDALEASYLDTYSREYKETPDEFYETTWTLESGKNDAMEWTAEDENIESTLVFHTDGTADFLWDDHYSESSSQSGLEYTRCNGEMYSGCSNIDWYVEMFSSENSQEILASMADDGNLEVMLRTYGNAGGDPAICTCTYVPSK